ncbi:MAG: SpoVR family protein, partial [Gammaproteobacteria bacterium]
ERELVISAIHDDSGYRKLRTALSNQYNLSMNEPNIQITSVDMRGDRSLTLTYVPHNDIPLADDYVEVLKHLHRLWGFPVHLVQKSSDGSETLIASCPPEEKQGVRD